MTDKSPCINNRASTACASGHRKGNWNMRVIAGTARSLPLKAPKGMDTRPTTDRIKETLFNILQPYLLDSVFVDLFAGSGAIGIEALSRGAKKCYFVEQEREASECILDNLKFTHFTDQAVLFKQDVFSALYQIFEKEADLIFLDPPYGKEYEKKVLDALKDVKYVTDNTIIIVEANLSTDFSYTEEMGFEIFKQKKYKTNQHVFLRKSRERL